MKDAQENKKLAIMEALAVLSIDTTRGQKLMACCLLEAFYLEYYNEFLTAERYSEYWGLPLVLTQSAIEYGRLYHMYREVK